MQLRGKLRKSFQKKSNQNPNTIKSNYKLKESLFAVTEGMSENFKAIPEASDPDTVVQMFF